MVKATWGHRHLWLWFIACFLVKFKARTPSLLSMTLACSPISKHQVGVWESENKAQDGKLPVGSSSCIPQPLITCAVPERRAASWLRLPEAQQHPPPTHTSLFPPQLVQRVVVVGLPCSLGTKFSVTEALSAVAPETSRTQAPTGSPRVMTGSPAWLATWPQVPVPATKDSSQMMQPAVSCPKVPGRERAALGRPHTLPFPVQDSVLCWADAGFSQLPASLGLPLTLPSAELIQCIHRFQKGGQSLLLNQLRNLEAGLQSWEGVPGSRIFGLTWNKGRHLPSSLSIAQAPHPLRP